MENNYDAIARYYDVLSRLVFRRSQVSAQTDQLHYIPAESRILIVGGGTGWILEEIVKTHLSGLNITYVEISANMLELASKRPSGNNEIRFLNLSIEDLPQESTYDVIHTAFLFDNFSGPTVEKVFRLLDRQLRGAGLWLFSDFQTQRTAGKFWQRWLLRTMYFFFRRISSVQAQDLVNTEPLFEAHSYKILQSRVYYSGFIKANVYRKS